MDQPGIKILPELEVYLDLLNFESGIKCQD